VSAHPLCPVSVPAADTSPPSTHPRPRPSRSASAPTMKLCRARLRCGAHPVLYPHRCIAAAPFPRGDSMSTPCPQTTACLRRSTLFVPAFASTLFARTPVSLCIHPAAASAPRCRPTHARVGVPLPLRNGIRATYETGLEARSLVSTARGGECGRRVVASGGMRSLSEHTWRPRARPSRSVPIPPCDDVGAKYETKEPQDELRLPLTRGARMGVAHS
jgi:hypothetical protein